ncbi:MAG: dihydroorotate dehydrogenase electron transfer subunit [Planctomycetota bacterium]
MGRRCIFTAKVCWNKMIGQRFYRLRLEVCGEGAAAFANAMPGQFVEIDASNLRLPALSNIPEQLQDTAQRHIILRRPFSFADIEVPDDSHAVIEIVYCVLGPATMRMTTLERDDQLSVIGPLGNGFKVSENSKAAILVAGGMGAAPLQYLAKHIKGNYPTMEVIVMAGARNRRELPFSLRTESIRAEAGEWLDEFARYGVESIVATDDGSAGFAGFVTEALERWLDNCPYRAEEMMIFACGPEPMLAQSARIASKSNIPCQVSMERMMGCGFGVCQSCVVACRADGGDESCYKLCCEDGPVFDSREVIFRV